MIATKLQKHQIVLKIELRLHQKDSFVGDCHRHLRPLAILVHLFSLYRTHTLSSGFFGLQTRRER